MKRKEEKCHLCPFSYAVNPDIPLLTTASVRDPFRVGKSARNYELQGSAAMSLSTSKGRAPWEIQRTFQENKQNPHTKIMHRGANEAVQFAGRRCSQQGPRLSFVAGGEGAMRRGCSVPNWQTEIKK